LDVGLCGADDCRLRLMRGVLLRGLDGGWSLLVGLCGRDDFRLRLVCGDFDRLLDVGLCGADDCRLRLMRGVLLRGLDGGWSLLVGLSGRDDLRLRLECGDLDRLLDVGLCGADDCRVRLMRGVRCLVSLLRELDGGWSRKFSSFLGMDRERPRRGPAKDGLLRLRLRRLEPTSSLVRTL